MTGEKNHQFGLLGDKNASWKSDEKINYYGYKMIRVLDHPFRNINNFVFEHRLLAEKYLMTDEQSIEVNGKKYLKPELDVHHIDQDKSNNSIDNLIIVSKKEHRKIHNKLDPRDRDEFGRFKPKKAS